MPTSLRIAFAFVLALLAASPAFAGELVGPESCRSCHAEAYRAWQGSAHARAFSTLSPEQQKQPLCLQCHAPELARERGHAQVVAGVTCESCHGPGRAYQAEAVMRDKELAHLAGLQDTSPASCLTCHGGDAPSLHAFDPKVALPRIDHWSAERAARGKAQPPKEGEAPGKPAASLQPSTPARCPRYAALSRSAPRGPAGAAAPGAPVGSGADWLREQLAGEGAQAH